MARRIQEAPPAATNPRFFGEDMEDLALKAVGLAATATVNDTLMVPIAGKIGGGQSGTVAKLIDAATTGVSAWLLGTAVGLLSSHFGKQLQTGGLILAAGKGIAAFVPGLSLSAKLALPAGIPVFGAPAVTTTTAVPQISGGQQALVTRFPPNPSYGTLIPSLSVGL